jgi:hypothetical protein
MVASPKLIVHGADQSCGPFGAPSVRDEALELSHGFAVTPEVALARPAVAQSAALVEPIS